MQTLILIFFIIFSFIIYYIKNIYFLLFLFIIFFSILLFLKIKLKGLKPLLLFLGITILINLFYLDILSSCTIGLRLLIIYFLTLMISFYMSNKDIAKSISNLFFFLKNKKDLELIIALSLSLIPILSDELKNVRKVLINKNFNFSFLNCLKRPNIFLNTYLNNLFQRIKELEKTLIKKNY